MGRLGRLCLLLAALLALGLFPAWVGEAEELGLTENDESVAEIEALVSNEAALGEAENPTALQKLILPEALVLGKKEQTRLQPVAVPAEAVYSLSCASDDDCVSVTEDGLLTARKQGAATVTVTSDNGVSASVRVTVLAAPKKIAIQAGRTRLCAGESTRLACRLPEGSAGTCTFSAKADGVLDVTPEGLVTALAPGSATVTATAYNGKTAEVKLTVLPPFEITFMNIGRNDGILIQCGGEYAFVDSGMRGQGLQAVRYMKKQEVPRLKYYIGSHAHEDHVGGAPAILAAMEVDEVIVNHSRTPKMIKSYAKTSAEKKAARAAKYRVVKAGQTFGLGGAEFLVLGPVKLVKVSPRETAENGNSLILRVTYGENTFLLTGDATGSEITSVQKANPGCMRAQVLKNPHHYGRQEYIVKLCKPEITVFSTGKRSLPASGYLHFIKKRGSQVYITASNRDGHVTIASDGKNLTFKTQKKHKKW